jgi:hypothetical protein
MIYAIIPGDPSSVPDPDLPGAPPVPDPDEEIIDPPYWDEDEEIIDEPEYYPDDTPVDEPPIKKTGGACSMC